MKKQSKNSFFSNCCVFGALPQNKNDLHCDKKGLFSSRRGGFVCFLQEKMKATGKEGLACITLATLLLLEDAASSCEGSCYSYKLILYSMK